MVKGKIYFLCNYYSCIVGELGCFGRWFDVFWYFILGGDCNCSVLFFGDMVLGGVFWI